MSHSKKKAAILTTATSLVAYAAAALSAGNHIEAGVLLAISAGLFGLYEYFQVDEIPVSEDQLRNAADQAADAIEEKTSQKRR